MVTWWWGLPPPRPHPRASATGPLCRLTPWREVASGITVSWGVGGCGGKSFTPYWGTPFAHVGSHRGGAGVPRRVMVSYADGAPKYHTFQRESCERALALGAWECFLFNRTSLPPDYLAVNRGLLDTPQGRGLWSWKAISIFMAMQMVADGDTLFYMDAGSYLHGNASALFKRVRSAEVMLFADCLWTVGQYSARSSLTLLNGDAFRNRSMPLAGWSLWRKSPPAQLFLARWLTYSQDFRVMSGVPFPGFALPNFPEFRDHRHDMTALIISAYHANPTLFRGPLAVRRRARVPRAAPELRVLWRNHQGDSPIALLM